MEGTTKLYGRFFIALDGYGRYDLPHSMVMMLLTAADMRTAEVRKAMLWNQ